MNSMVVDSAGKRLGSTWALNDVSFEINQGEVFGLFGRSGSGKSTLIRLISGLDQPTSGSVDFQVTEEEDDSWLDARVSIALQAPGLAPDLTAAENLSLFSSLWKSPRKGRASRIAMFIELLGLAGARNRRIGVLPEGMRAACEIARALVPRTEVYAIDGLIERLDRPIRRRLWEYILSRKRHGETFVVSTASADEAALCDRLAALVQGRLAYVGSPGDLMAAVRNEVIVVESARDTVLKSKLKDRFGAAVTERGGTVEFRSCDASADIARIFSEMSSDVGCVYLREPTLDDALDRMEGS